MVEKCRLCVKKDEKINFIDEQGTLINLPDFQTVFLPTLEEFLIRKPSCKPFVDFAKIVPIDDSKPSKYFDDSKGLKKEDTIRANVKKTILDQLMTRAKKNKVGVSRKATLDLSEQIEVELYRIHKNARNSKYKQWCADFFSQVANESNMFFKSVVSNVYTAKKLVLMKKEEMFLEFTPEQTPAPQAPKVVKNVPKTPVASAVDIILGEEGMDTTSKHNSHEFDSNCQICISKMKEKQATMELMARDREELLQDRKRRRELGKQKAKPPSPTNPDRWESSSSSGKNKWSSATTTPVNSDRWEPSTSGKHRWSPTAATSPMKTNRREASSSSQRPRWSPNAMIDHVDNISDRSFSPSRNQSPKGYSRMRSSTPKKSKVITPPPGVSPDRFAVKRISPGGRNESSSLWEKPMDRPVGYDELRSTLKEDTRHPIRTPGMRFPNMDSHTSWRKEQWRESRANNNYFNSERRVQGDFEEVYRHPMESPPLELGPSPNSPSRFFDMERSSGNMSLDDSGRSLEFEPQRNPEHRSPRNEGVSLWTTMSSTIWTGQLAGEGFELRASLKAISNPASFDLKGKLPSLIPIKARVRTEAMWKFIREIRNQKKYQTLLYVLESEEGSLEEYSKCYADFERSRRYFVLGFPENLNVKEAYMFNIDPYQSLPSVLLPVDGPGLPLDEVGKKLICVVVIRRYEMKALNSPTATRSQTSGFDPSQSQKTWIRGSLNFKSPRNLDEILVFIEETTDAGIFLKGVQEFIKNHKLTAEEKTIVQNACSAKIQKQKKQTMASRFPSSSEDKFKEKEQNQDVEMREDQELQEERNIERDRNLQEDIVMEERTPRIEDDEDLDDKMEIVEPSDDEDEKNILNNMRNSNSPNSIEAGEVRDSPVLINNENGKMPFILPPPPPPPTMNLPRPRLDPYFSPILNVQQNGNVSFHSDLEDGELRAVTPPPQFIGISPPKPMGIPPRGRGKKNNIQRGRGNPGNFGPIPHRFQMPPQEFFPSPQPPRMFSRFEVRPMPPQDVAFAQRPNFRGRPTRPMRMPMGGGLLRPGIPPRGFRGIRPRFPPF
ncbi:hypothetical protein FO519_005644 [Halicephalobus sp. NKZ332]|nr:hypothetical protein FO519_005644 [Halicephalobus sp. NKZ332]